MRLEEGQNQRSVADSMWTLKGLETDEDHEMCWWGLPEVNKVDELGGELPILRVAEVGRFPLHHLGQLIKDTVPLGVGEASRGQLVLKANTHRWTKPVKPAGCKLTVRFPAGLTRVMPKLHTSERTS